MAISNCYNSLTSENPREFSGTDIKKFSKQRKRMFKIVKRFKYSLVTLTASSAIVLGLQLGENMEVIQNQKNTALVIGAIATALTTLMTFWNVEEYWLQSKVIEQQLENLRNKVEFEKLNTLSREKVNELFAEYQNIIGQQQSYWKAALDEKNEN